MKLRDSFFSSVKKKNKVKLFYQTLFLLQFRALFFFSFLRIT